MYPDWALYEFYPAWLIEEADKRCHTLQEIHAFATPIMKMMKYHDFGREWCVSRGLL